MQAGNCNSAWQRLTLLQIFLPALLALLLPNTIATHTITYTNVTVILKYQWSFANVLGRCIYKVAKQ